MKNTLALVLMVFGIVGCGVLPLAYKYEIHTSHQLFEDDTYQHFIYEKYDDIQWSDGYWTGGDIIAIEAMTKDTGEFYFRTYVVTGAYAFFPWGNYYLEVLDNCKKVFNLDCVITRSDRQNMPEESEVFYLGLEDYQLRQEQNKRAEEINRQTKIATRKREEEETKRRKQNIIIGLTQRCEEYGFSGESNISACIQREAQHDKELAMQRLELQRTFAQNLTEPVPEEEDLPFLVKFLGDVAMGVAENLADPNFHRNLQQQKETNQLKANQNRDIWRDCRPNC